MPRSGRAGTAWSGSRPRFSRSETDRPRYHPRDMTEPPAGDPLTLFREVFAQAAARETGDPTAVALATVGPSGAPSLRVVLLKGVDERGFTFYTNYESRKARELETEPRAALCFYWPIVGVQGRGEGATERVGDPDSDAYFATRPRESQLGAWASLQSRPLGSRAELVARMAEAAARFPGQ